MFLAKHFQQSEYLLSVIYPYCDSRIISSLANDEIARAHVCVWIMIILIARGKNIFQDKSSLLYPIVPQKSRQLFKSIMEVGHPLLRLLILNLFGIKLHTSNNTTK